MTRVLVMGGDGMLGHMLCRVLPARHETWCTIRRAWSDGHPLARVIDRTKCIDQLDVRSDDHVRSALASVGPDWVINAVGIVKQLPQAHDAVASVDCNARFPHALALTAQETGGRVMQVSTDCVFSGRRGSYRLDDLPDPVDLYGRTKLVGELAEDEGLTLRTSIVGRQMSGDNSLFEWALSQRGNQVSGFTNAIYSGLTTMALSRIISTVLESHHEMTGLFHVASSAISKFDLLRGLNERCGLGFDILADESFLCDRSLDGSVFERATGLSAPSWAAMLDDFAQDQSFYAFRDQ